MRGEISSGKHAKRHPYDWYVDEVWCAEQLARQLNDFASEKAAGEVFWDPAAGLGNTVDALIARGFQCYLSDVVERVEWVTRDVTQWPVFSARDVENHPKPIFFSADFLEVEEAPARCSVVCNPPYSYRKGHGEYGQMIISEAFARHAIKLVTACGGTWVCMLVPSKWLASQGRYRLFQEFPPAQVMHLTQRPSMPPGDMIAAMGNRAFRGGMTDYCWIVWNVRAPTAPGETRTIWLPPLKGSR